MERIASTEGGVDALSRCRVAWADSEEEVLEQIRIGALPRDERSVVYTEKYATFRHFDTLRWQIPGLIFTVGGLLFSLAPRTSSGLPHPFAAITYGVFAVAGSFVMYRIRLNLRENNRALRRYAISFGDLSIPPPPVHASSASSWMQSLLLVLGMSSLAVAVAELLSEK